MENQIIPSFQSPVLLDQQFIAEIIDNNLEGMSPEFYAIKFPSGGGVAFEVLDDNGEVDAIKEIQGVIIDHHPMNSFYAKKFDGGNESPDCSSLDGEIGYAKLSAPLPWAGDKMHCSLCPANKFDEDGTKKCRNQRRVHLMRENEIFPIRITIPPTSLKAFKDYIMGLTSKAIAFQSVVTSIKLKKAESKGGIIYSAAVFSKVKTLKSDEFISMKKYGISLKSYLRTNVTVDEPEVIPLQPNPIVDISDADTPF